MADRFNTTAVHSVITILGTTDAIVVSSGINYISLAINAGCVPQNPFYIRWINSIAGYDYKMWGRRTVYEDKLSDLEVVQKHILASGQTYLQEQVSATLEETVSVGEDALSRDEYDHLNSILRSPLIEWYNEEIQKWITITVSEQTNRWDTRSGLGSIAYSFGLPPTSLQY